MTDKSPYANLCISIAKSGDLALLALMVVAGLHKPIRPPEGKRWISGGNEPHCEGCSTGDPYMDPDWPCETIKVIQKALESE